MNLKDLCSRVVVKCGGAPGSVAGVEDIVVGSFRRLLGYGAWSWARERADLDVGADGVVFLPEDCDQLLQVSVPYQFFGDRIIIQYEYLCSVSVDYVSSAVVRRFADGGEVVLGSAVEEAVAACAVADCARFTLRDERLAQVFEGLYVREVDRAFTLDMQQLVRSGNFEHRV